MGSMEFGVITWCDKPANRPLTPAIDPDETDFLDINRSDYPCCPGD